MFLVEDHPGNSQHRNSMWRLARETLRQINGAIEILLHERGERVVSTAICLIALQTVSSAQAPAAKTKELFLFSNTGRILRLLSRASQWVGTAS